MFPAPRRLRIWARFLFFFFCLRRRRARVANAQRAATNNPTSRLPFGLSCDLSYNCLCGIDPATGDGDFSSDALAAIGASLGRPSCALRTLRLAGNAIGGHYKYPRSRTDFQPNVKGPALLLGPVLGRWGATTARAARADLSKVPCIRVAAAAVCTPATAAVFPTSPPPRRSPLAARPHLRASACNPACRPHPCALRAALPATHAAVTLAATTRVAARADRGGCGCWT